MKKILLALVFTTGAHAADYTVDPLHTNARFEIDHFNTSSNVGGIYEITGSLQFDAEKGEGSVEVMLPLKNLQASSKAFTNHLMSEDIFNATQFPEIIFKSTKVNFEGKKVVSVDGELTMHGKTNSVQLKADKFNCYDSPMAKTEVCGGDFSTVIDRTLWGIDYLVNVGMTKDVKITVQVEAAKK